MWRFTGTLITFWRVENDGKRTPLLQCSARSMTEADKVFSDKFGKSPISDRNVVATTKPPKFTAGPVLLATGLFTSKGDCVRLIKGKAVKINGELVESFDEPIEACHIQQGAFVPGWASLARSLDTWAVLIIRRGKVAAAVQLMADGTVTKINLEG